MTRSESAHTTGSGRARRCGSARLFVRVLARALAFPAALLCAGCIPAPTGLRPDVALPNTWRIQTEAGDSFAAMSYAEVFEDPNLIALISEALVANHDLRIAIQRVEIARANVGIQRSVEFPQLGGTASAQRLRGPGADPNNNQVTSLGTLAFSLPTWEIDVWGRLRSLTGSAQAKYLSSEQIQRGVYISLISEVASRYIDLVGLDDQLRISYDTVVSREKSLVLVQSRHRAGIASGLDVRQAEYLVYNARAAISDFERLRMQTENGLSVLVGRNPGPVTRSSSSIARSLPPLLPAGLPSSLLERRPDIVSAAELVHGSEFDVDAAKKAFLPTISLTGMLGFVSPELKNIVTGGRYAWSALPAINIPIFTAGQLEAELDSAKASQLIAIEDYRRVVQNALREVDDALNDYQQFLQQRDWLLDAVKANRERLRLTELRYRNGISSFFEVLDAQRQLFEGELAWSQTNRDAYKSVVTLYRTVGGGWQQAAASNLPPPR